MNAATGGSTRSRGGRSGAGAAAARTLSAVAVVGVVAGITLAGSRLPVPEAVRAVESAVRVPATATTLVCPGPLAAAQGPVGGDAAFDPAPVAAVTSQRLASTRVGDLGAGAVTLSPLAGGAPLAALEPGARAGVATLPGPTGPTVLRAEPVGDAAATAGGTIASVTSQGDLRGLAAATCQAPAAGIWLVGGSTEIGSSALLVVANPGSTPAEVSVAVWGPSGPVDDLAGGTFLVAPGVERGVLLEGVAAEQRRIAVHVTAAGGLVTAHLQDSRLNGFTPAGTDLVTAGSVPATRQVVGGLVVPATQTGAADAAQVRLLAPGDRRALATLTLLGPDGRVMLPGAERVDLGPGEVTDVSLAGLPAGHYTAVVDADVPVVAGAVLTRQGPPVELDDIPTLERAWSAAGPVGRPGVVAVPDGVTGTLVVGGVAPPGSDPQDGEARGTVRVLGADGAVLSERAVSVAAGTSQRLATTAPPGAVVAAIEVVPEPGGDPQDPASAPALAWSVLATVGGGPDELLSVLTPVPGPEDQPTVLVRRGDRLGLP